MKKSILKYRKPGQALVALNGVFVPWDGVFSHGFFLSNANKSKIWIFNEGESELCDHSNSNDPFVISKEDYIGNAEQLIKTLNDNKLQKGVYSRVKKSEIKQSHEAIFGALCSAYPEAFVYYFNDPRLGEWLGATPEVLIRNEEKHTLVISLAGTLRADAQEDWTEKERQEQMFVTEFILDKLEDHNADKLLVTEAYEVLAGPVKHLRSDIIFEAEKEDAFAIALDLHPTPAVCGLPRSKAMQVLASLEPHDRELYTGFIGIIDEGVSLYVNLRCAKLNNNNAFLFLGGGFTKDSDPEKEWMETEHKSRTLLNIFERLNENEKQ
mgnify:CR=1 FL=1